jgi:hypothetical protein
VKDASILYFRKEHFLRFRLFGFGVFARYARWRNSYLLLLETDASGMSKNIPTESGYVVLLLQNGGELNPSPGDLGEHPYVLERPHCV